MLTPAILGIARHLLTLGGGYLIAQGVVNAEQAETLVGAGVAVIGVVWSLIEKRTR